MHILIAAHDVYPDPGAGGTGRYVYETARQFVRRGHDVSIITRRRSDSSDHATLDGIQIYRYDLAIAERTAREIIGQIPHAAASVSHHVGSAVNNFGKPDILSYQGPVTSAFVDRAVVHNPPKVLTFHSPWPREYRIKAKMPERPQGLRRYLNVMLRRYVEGRLLAGADRIVVLSSFMGAELRRVHGSSLRSTVIPGGVDADQFSPSGPTIDGVRGDTVFLTVRRLTRRMGHDLLFQAFSNVLEEKPGARLYIAGDGPLRSHLEEIARAYEVTGATTFLGYVPDEHLPSLYRSADIFVLPTKELEGFGLATLEALASGVPVVTTPIGGTLEVMSKIEDRTGLPERLLVRSVDPIALAKGMLGWASLSDDELSAAGRACRNCVATGFRWEGTVTCLEQVYTDLLLEEE